MFVYVVLYSHKILVAKVNYEKRMIISVRRVRLRINDCLSYFLLYILICFLILYISMFLAIVEFSILLVCLNKCMLYWIMTRRVVMTVTRCNVLTLYMRGKIYYHAFNVFSIWFEYFIYDVLFKYSSIYVLI